MNVLNIDELAKENFKFYRCGSPNLKNFLINNGMEYIYSYRSRETSRIIWVFVECKRLSNLLTIWSSNKPNGSDTVE